MARRECEDVRPVRVHGGEPRDAIVGVRPRRALVALRLPPQVDFGLHDEDRVDVLADDPKERRIAFRERLLRIDQVKHGIGRRQELQSGAPMRRIDRRQPRRVRDDEAALEKR